MEDTQLKIRMIAFIASVAVVLSALALAMSGCTPTENATFAPGTGSSGDGGNTEDDGSATDSADEGILQVDAPTPPQPTITFDLPEEWRPAQRSGGTLPHWSTYIPDPPEGIGPGEKDRDEREQQHLWKFTLMEIGGEYGSDIPRGKTAKETAEWFYEHSAPGCTTEKNCTIKPISEAKQGGVTTYTIEEVNKSGEILYKGEFITVFFEKDGHIFELDIRGLLDDPITQNTVKTVLTTIKIED